MRNFKYIIFIWTQTYREIFKSALMYFNQDRFTHARPPLKTLNPLNVYQINLLQVLFMRKIIKNSSPQIFLHQFQAINHKHATRYSRNHFKEAKWETNYAKYCIHARGPVIWTSFLNAAEKKHTISAFL